MAADPLRTETFDLVIIGAGSAGLAAAGAAAEAGVGRILVLEKEDFPGGILLQCVHNGFGLHRYKEELTGPEYAERALIESRKTGIDLRCGAMVLKITPEKEIYYSGEKYGCRLARAKAVICATGADERTRGAIRIPGDRPAGVMTAGLAQHYMNLDGYMVGRRVFILGSGDIGLIMARRVTLEGGKVLGVAELMPYSNGLARNIAQCLNDFDIPLYLSHTVREIRGKKRLEQIVLSQVDGNFAFVPGTEKTFDVDALLLSVGLIPSNRLLTDLGVRLHPKTGGPVVDETLQTSIPGIFSCGNSLHVHDLADFVSSEGENAGRSAAKYILGELDASPGDSPVIRTEPGEGIGYLLPSVLHADRAAEFLLKFRVRKPYHGVALLLKQNGGLIKKIKKPYLLPAEMESLRLKRDELPEPSGTLTLEVADE
ncbi:MAG: FAD-dependent oxidoreductase [Thermoguttaceae bacterium]|nr:FAD-dependent oxidoreductase [Thermoguttaceae bacterium]